MKVLLFSPAARTDIDAIWDYSAEQWGMDQADRYIDEIHDACRALASGAKRGRDADIRPGYRKLTTGSHILYFRESDDRIDIIRILHAKQDTERHI